MCDIIRWKSRQKRGTVQKDIDNVGVIPFSASNTLQKNYATQGFSGPKLFRQAI